MLRPPIYNLPSGRFATVLRTVLIGDGCQLQVTQVQRFPRRGIFRVHIDDVLALGEFEGAEVYGFEPSPVPGSIDMFGRTAGTSFDD